MSIKVRQRYLSVNNLTYEVTKINSSGIVIENFKSKKLFKYSLLDFQKAIKENKIRLIIYKSKSKKYEHPEWLKNYLDERDKIIESENKNKTS